MTPAEAHAAAAAEGLALLRAENETGFKGVNRGGFTVLTLQFGHAVVRLERSEAAPQDLCAPRASLKKASL